MTSKDQIPENTILVRKDSSIQRTADHIDHELDRLTEVQIRCAGTAIEKGILVAEKCVELGIAQYSRFTTQMIPFEDRQILYAIIKLKRSIKASKQQPAQKKQQKQPQKSSNLPKRSQNNNRKQSEEQYEPERNRRQAYNDDHRERNERREHQKYERGNFQKGQKNNQRNYNEPDRRDRDYR